MNDKCCPICGAFMNTWIDYENHGVCQYGGVCPDGCYSYEYHYGAHRVVVGDKQWSYHTSLEDELRNCLEIAAEIERIKGGRGG